MTSTADDFERREEVDRRRLEEQLGAGIRGSLVEMTDEEISVRRHTGDIRGPGTPSAGATYRPPSSTTGERDLGKGRTPGDVEGPPVVRLRREGDGGGGGMAKGGKGFYG